MKEPKIGNTIPWLKPAETQIERQAGGDGATGIEHDGASDPGM
jgi:hypothetical protein